MAGDDFVQQVAMANTSGRMKADVQADSQDPRLLAGRGVDEVGHFVSRQVKVNMPPPNTVSSVFVSHACKSDITETTFFFCSHPRL